MEIEGYEIQKNCTENAPKVYYYSMNIQVVDMELQKAKLNIIKLP